MSGISKNPRADEIVLELQSILTEAEAINTNTDGLEALITAGNALLTSLDGKDFATETTLNSIDTLVNDLKTLLTSIDGKDFATEATLAAVETQTALLTFIGDRLKVDAEITISPEDGSGAAHYSIAQSATSVTLLAANPLRKEVWILNATTSNKDLYVSYKATATLATPLVFFKGDNHNDNNYTGEISGIWGGSGSGVAEIIEVFSV